MDVDTIDGAVTTVTSAVNVTENNMLNIDSDAIVASEETGDSSNATHVTIQLPDSMQGSTLSQQKLQDLILQLSQSGQIQLKEDSKIVIDLKFSVKSDDQTVSEEAGEKLTTMDDSLSPRNSVPVSSVSGDTIKMSPNLTRATILPSKSDQALLSSTLNRQPLQQQQQQQQQPTYILLPAGQFPGATDNQLYSSPSQLRAVSAGGTMIRTLGAGAVGSTGGGNLNSQDRNLIFLQQPLSGASGTVGSVANSMGMSQTGATTVVPLRQLAGVGGSVGRVAGNTTWVAAGTNRFVGPGGGGGGEVYVSNTVPRVNPANYLTIATGSMSREDLKRESSWQQYVKQFTKLGPCPICGDKISGYHYGIFCCESCKGFFKRTVQNAKRYACHHPSASSVCEINVSSRKKCPACRFLKCVDKGMRIEAIRSDRTRGGRSMYPGSRYLRQIAARVGPGRPTNGMDPSTDMLLGKRGDDAKQMQCTVVGLSGVHHELGPDGLPSSMDAGGGVYLDPAILGVAHGEEDEETDQSNLQMDQSILDFPGSMGLNNTSCSTPYVGRQVVVPGGTDSLVRVRVELPKAISDILAVEESIEAEPEDALEIDPSSTPPGSSVPEGVSEDEAAVYRALLHLADQRLYRTVRWSRALPEFAQLDTDDQILLLQNCWADLLCLDCCWRSMPTPTEIRLTSSKCINLEAARELGAEEMVDRMLQLTQFMTHLQLDLVEYSCLKVIILMQPDMKNLKATAHVRQYQDTIRQMLIDYMNNSCPGKRDKYTKMMSRIPELRSTSQSARLMLADLDLSPYLSSNSLLMELLRSDIQRFSATGANPLAIEMGLEAKSPAMILTTSASETAEASESHSTDDEGADTTGTTMAPDACQTSSLTPPAMRPTEQESVSEEVYFERNMPTKVSPHTDVDA